MNGIARPQRRHLTLDKLNVNLKLARRLPPAVARCYHALPVAEDSGRITVAMADPDDPVAREAVVTALGAPSCVVGCDAEIIDALLASVWPEGFQTALRVLVSVHNSPISDQVLEFAQALCELLGARLGHFRLADQNATLCDDLVQQAQSGGYDLVIWGEPDQPLRQRLRSGPAYHEVVERMPTSLLVTRRPRWPLKRLLLVVQGEGIDDPALGWILRLARPGGTTVTALAIVPPVPALYDPFVGVQQGLDALLTTDTVLGRQMRRVAQQLVDWEIEGTLRLRQGAPVQAVRCEVAQGGYDMIVLAQQPNAKWRCWLMGDWVTSLLAWADRPLLIAKLIPA